MSGTYTSNLKLDLIDHEMKRAVEVLGEKTWAPPGQSQQRHETRRYAAVLVLREIAFSMPTFFFQVILTNLPHDWHKTEGDFIRFHFSPRTRTLSSG